MLFISLPLAPRRHSLNSGERKRREKMGEKGDEKPKKADGEKKQKDGGGGAAAGDKKKDDGPTTVVLKVDMHCEGCALKVKRSVKGFEGVETVATDLESNKLTVVGKFDPVELRERVEVKTRKKVDLISPTNASKAKNGGGGGDAKKPAAAGGGENKDQKKPTGDQKPKQPQVSTLVLKIRLHCEGCTQRIVKTIRKVKGVENVLVESGKDLVTVKGTMDTKTLPTLLKEKLKRGVEVVPPKKENGGGGGGEKKKEGGGGGGEKKKEGGGGGGGGGEKKKESGSEKEEKATTGMGVATMNKMEYYGPYGPYRMEMAHAPQMFSDENPNACSIM